MKKFTKPVLALGLGAALITSASFAASHSNVSNKAVQARHAQMTMISYHTGVLAGIAKGDAEFDAAVVKAAASNLSALAKMDGATLWVAGTEQGAVEGSRAKAEIWSDPEGYAAKFNDLAMAAEAMMAAGDAGAVGAAMGGIGGSCKGCHQTYRGPKN